MTAPPRPPRAKDPELLYGVLAVQLGYATSEQVMAAAGAWAADPVRSLADRLEADGVLTGERRELLERAVHDAVARGLGERSLDEDPASPTPEDAAPEDAKKLQSFGGGAPKAVRAELSGGERGPPGVTPEAPGRYRLVDKHGARVEGANAAAAEMGRGGIGRVLRAFDEHLGRDVALKELLPSPGGSEPTPSLDPSKGASKSGTAAHVARFLREARVTGQLEHPGIPPVYEVGQREDGTLYYAMRLVRGRTFADVIRASSGSSTSAVQARLRALPTFIDVCQAVAYAHSRGVVHRDIKPENIMVGEYGETVLLDWGLAKVRGQKDVRSKAIAREVALLARDDVGRTLQGHAIGTPAYMSPEQAEGKVDEIDERSDVWSLGAVLYELLTARAPYVGTSPYEVIGKVLRGQAPPIRSVVGDAPGELVAICEKAMQRDKASRYATAKELAADVESYRAGDRVGAYQYSSLEMLERFIKDYRAPLAVAAVAALVLVVTAGVAYARVVDERDGALMAKANAREALTEAFVEKAHWSAAHDDDAEAALYAAAALGVTETPEARAILAGIDPSARPSLAWQKRWRGLGCRQVRFVQAGSRLVCDDGKAAILLDPLTGEERGRVAIESRHLALDDDARWLAAATGGPDVALFELATGREVARLRSGLSDVRRVAFGDEGRLLFTGDDVGVVRVWDREHGKELLALEGHEGPVTSIAVTAGAQTVAVATEEGPLRVWSLARDRPAGDAPDVSMPGELVDPRTGLAPLTAALAREVPLGADALAFSSDGRRLAAAVGPRRAVHVVDVPTGRESMVLAGHTDRVLDAGFGGELVVTASADHTLGVWSLASGRRLFSLKGFYGEVASVALDAERGLLAAGDPTVGLRVFQLPGPRSGGEPGDVVRAEPRADLRQGRAGLSAAALHPDGGALLVADDERTVRLVDVASGETTRRFRHGVKLASGIAVHEGEILEVATGRGIVAAATRRTAQAWDLGSGRSLGILGGQGSSSAMRVLGLYLVPRSEGPAEAFAYGQAGEGDEARFVTWSLTERSAPHPLADVPKTARALAFAEGGARYAFGDGEGEVTIVDVHDGGRPRRVRGRGGVVELHFGAGGELFAAWEGGQLAVVDADTGHIRAELKGAEPGVASASFSPSGRWLAVVAPSGGVRVWDVEEGGGPRAAFSALPGVRAATFTLDEDALYLAGAAGLLRRLRLSPLAADADDLVAEAERTTGLTLAGTRLLPRWPAIPDGAAEVVELARAPTPKPVSGALLSAEVGQ